MRNVLVGALVVLAILQIWVLTTAAADPEARWLAASDNLADIEVAIAGGEARSLALGEPTLLLVFHSECGHCRRVAPVWSDWLEAHGNDVRTLALSAEPHEIAAGYAEEHGWPVEVGVVLDVELGTPAHALTGRTPWIFAIDAAGDVIGEGHGEDIARIAALLPERTAR